jgi:SAM-dependent methyltransferase
MEKEMSVYLATTWYPRGELPRFIRFLPMLEETYTGIVISYIPSDDQNVMQQFTTAEFSSDSNLTFYVNDDQRRGRYMALKRAIETPADFIHYVDMDRLLHWLDTQPEEWKQMVGEIEKSDCIIFGRTEAAFLTHPQALITTEKISNQVVSYVLKKDMDVSAGSKSFSRPAAQYIVDHCHADNSIGTDAEWPIRLQQAGFSLKYIQVEGLDWESADQFQLLVANAGEQARAARAYDADPKNWSYRIEIANEIIRTALQVSQILHPILNINTIKPMEFDYDTVFNVDDYLYFYSEDLTDVRTDLEVNALVKLLALDQPKKILDLACGFGRHTNRLAVMGHKMTGVDITPGFLEIARQDAIKKGVEVHYQQNDMRTITFDNEFDCVLLLFTAFGYFSDDENLQVLINTRKALLPGGVLIFDTPHRDTFLKRMQPYFIVEKEGNMMIDRMSFDCLQGRSYNRRVVIREGIRKDKPFFVRLYNPNEIQDLITRAGLVLEHIYGGWETQELTPETNRIVIIARKPESI